jgi:superfamily II DNA or RNA helicase
MSMAKNGAQDSNIARTDESADAVVNEQALASESASASESEDALIIPVYVRQVCVVPALGLSIGALKDQDVFTAPAFGRASIARTDDTPWRPATVHDRDMAIATLAAVDPAIAAFATRALAGEHDAAYEASDAIKRMPPGKNRKTAVQAWRTCQGLIASAYRDHQEMALERIFRGGHGDYWLEKVQKESAIAAEMAKVKQRRNDDKAAQLRSELIRLYNSAKHGQPLNTDAIDAVVADLLELGQVIGLDQDQQSHYATAKLAQAAAITCSTGPLKTASSAHFLVQLTYINHELRAEMLRCRGRNTPYRIPGITDSGITSESIRAEPKSANELAKRLGLDRWNRVGADRYLWTTSELKLADLLVFDGDPPADLKVEWTSSRRPVVRALVPADVAMQTPNPGEYLLRVTYLDGRVHAHLCRRRGANLLLHVQGLQASGSDAEVTRVQPERAQQIAALLRLDEWTVSNVEPFAWTTDEYELADILANTAATSAPHDLEVEWKARRRVVRTVMARDLRLRSSLKLDWFNLEGGTEFGGTDVTLVDLVRAVRSGGRYVKVGDDELVRIAEELRELLLPLADLEVVESTIRTPRLIALALSRNVDGIGGPLGVAWECMVEAEAAPLQLPSFAARLELKMYQQEGVLFLQRRAGWAAGACLADDMGLGKTRQILALLLQRMGKGPALVIAPLSVVRNWLSGPDGELAKPALFVTNHTDLRPGPGDVVVLSYDKAARIAAHLAKTAWTTIVYDEAHYLKNPAAKRTKTLLGVRGDFTVMVTGTPVENRPGDLWSLAQFFAPGLLGNLRQFRLRFSGPMADGDKTAASALAALVRPFVLRRTRKEHLPDLPPLTEIIEMTELSAQERKLYEAKRALAEQCAKENLAGLPEAKKKVIPILMHLREIAAHPGLHDEDFGDKTSKVLRLTEMLLENHGTEGHKAIVFSQWTRVLERLARVIAEAGLRIGQLDGRMTPLERAKAEEDFGAGKFDVFLISLKTGGVGLNLQTASYVYLFDPWWNPQAELQAICRAHRMGQQNPVTAIRLISRGTVEEKMQKLQAHKLQMFDDLMEGTGASAGLTPQDILDLLAPSVVGDDEDEDWD